MMTWPRKGSLLSFKLNSTATSDCGTQKLGNDLYHDSESIATIVCRRNNCKWKAMFESHVQICIDWTNFDFRFKDFLSNLLLKVIIYCVTTNYPLLDLEDLSYSHFSLFRIHHMSHGNNKSIQGNANPEIKSELSVTFQVFYLTRVY